MPVPYFHLVFTLPHALNGLIAWRPRTLYELLFAAVSSTLSEFTANPRWLGGEPAFVRGLTHPAIAISGQIAQTARMSANFNSQLFVVATQSLAAIKNRVFAQPR